jgi:hypothetical protein
MRPCGSQRRRAGLVAGAALLLLSTAPGTAAAQDGRENDEREPFAQEVVRRVAIDPTTYAPAIIVFTANHLDWSSSQPLFRLGYLEVNPRFTVSGRPVDRPIGYAEGNRRIAQDSATLFAWSVANNAGSAIIERALIDRAPRHRKLIRTLGWIERVAFASFWAHRLSARHFEQWRANERLARELGAR